MSKEVTLHYKKSFKNYSLVEYDHRMDIDYYENNFNYVRRRKKIPKYGYWSGGGTSKNIREEIFLENYANRLVSVYSDSVTIVIEEYENKISLKTYHTEKRRSVGSPYFRIRRWMKYCTYNLKTKNFYFGEVDRKNKSLINKKIRTNKFDIDFLNQLRLYIRRKVRDLVFGKYSSNPINADSITEETINVFFNILTHKTGVQIDYVANNLDAEIFKLYLEHNGFKYPDNYKEFARIFVSKQKLRKNNNLVSLIMNEMNLGGSRIKKIFNQQRGIDFQLIARLYNLLGVDYFNQLSDNVLLYGDTEQSSGIVYLESFKPDDYFIEFLSNSDKKRIVNVLNEKTRFSLILDHLRMIEKLKNNYGHDFKMKFTNRDSFDVEHYDLSELLSSYKKGDVSRSYGDYCKEKVEEPIMGVDGIDYYPVLLTTTKEYNNESFVQSNCVRTYVEKSSCFIISLREGSPDSEERGTIEYEFRRNEILRVQSLGKYNKNLSPRYDMPLEILDLRVNELYKKDILHLPKLVKKFKNGNQINRKAFFEDMENHGPLLNVTPVWDNNEDRSEDFLDWDLFI